MTESGKPHFAIDTTKPHSARLYDYYLGGKDWYPVDQKAGQKVEAACPSISIVAHENRGFMHRATRLLASEYGIRQFVDIGTGIPTEPNLHQIAQSVAPEARVVYADHDLTVLDYADALMQGTPEGRTAYIQADVRHDTILDSPRLREVIDLDKPVALSLVALLHFVPDEQRAYDIVRGLLDQLSPGSFLVLSHCTPDFDSTAWDGVKEVYDSSGTPVQWRSKGEVESFFEGLEMLEPGVVAGHRWRPERESEYTDAEVSLYAGVGRKP
jgi:hypothetical protein